MKKMTRKLLCVLLVLVLLCAGVTVAAVDADYTVSATRLVLGANPVEAEADGTTIFMFKPTAVGNYRITADDPAAVLNFWYGSAQFVSVPAADAVEGALTVTCHAVGQSLLIGLSGVDSATLTIEKQDDYVAPVKVTYITYHNRHTPSASFTMTDETLTAVDITKAQTVVADSNDIYHLGNVNGPIVYVDLRASVWTDLYKLFYPDDVEGEEFPPIDVMRGRYSETKGYDFVEAMVDYADALDEGYYYLTVDVAKYLQYFGTDQGWYMPQYSPYAPIREGKFIEESAWLVNTYYVAPPVAVGDVNGDGRINNRDLANLQKYLNEWDVTVETAGADLNGDGKINNRDLRDLQLMLNT